MQPEIQIYYNAIRQLNPKVTDEEWAYFESGFTITQYKPRAYIIEAGKPHHHLGFITSGLVRGFYINDVGEDITTLFEVEGGWVTDYPSLLLHKPSRYSFQCLEPATVIHVPFSHIQKGYDLFTGFERNGRLIAEEVLKAHQQRIESFQFENAEQRYLSFVDRHPQLFNRISLTHLSTYLGIERPSLSRIRKKLAGL